MLAEIFTVVAPVFLIAGCGYAWARGGLPFDRETVSGLVMNVASPCLVFSSLTSIDIDTGEFTAVVLATLVAIVAITVFFYVALRVAKQPVSVYLPVLVHPNTGNMGLPLALMAFGDAGLALAISYFFVNSVSQYTLGLGLASRSFHLSQLIRQPILWAVAAALLLRTTNWQVPEFLAATTEILGGFVIPAMLLMLGTSLANLQLTNIRAAAVTSVLRLVAGFVVGLGCIALFELEGVAAGVVLMQSTMPAAVFNYVFAERFGNAPETVAAVILLSTVMSFATLPLLVAYALAIAGTG